MGLAFLAQASPACPRDVDPWWSATGFDWLAGRNYLLFASLEAGPGQRFVGGGVKWSPLGDLDASGLRVLMRAGGAARTRSGALPIPTETSGESYALVGGEHLTGRGAIGIYLGHETALAWPALARRLGLPPETRSGLRIQADFWDHPAPDLLVHASAAASSAARQIWGRMALGWRFAGSAFLGPEVEVVDAGRYAKRRYGLHATGLRLFGLDWRLSGGRERASDRSAGLYATFGLHWRR